LIETDMAAIRLWWRPWDSKYFKAYHIYLTTDMEDGPFTHDRLMQPEYLVSSIEGTSYVDNVTLEFPTQVPVVYVVMVIENIYGHREWSEGEFINVDVMYSYYPPMDRLSKQWIIIEDFTKHEIELRWREWVPITLGGH